MAKSKIARASQTLAQSSAEGMRKISDAVVGGYSKIEHAVVDGYTRIEDKFVDRYLTRDGETVADAKKRLRDEHPQM